MSNVWRPSTASWGAAFGAMQTLRYPLDRFLTVSIAVEDKERYPKRARQPTDITERILTETGCGFAMVTWQEFALASVQAALFTPEHSTFAASRAVATILRQFGDQFDGEMQVLPIPADVPASVPRVVLQSADGQRRLQMAPARCDCFWNRLTPDDTSTLGSAVDRCVEVLERYVRETGTRVGRLGLIVQRTCPNERPAQTLIQRFCTPETQREPLNRSSTFEIHNHKEYVPARDGVSYKINSWVRCRCGVIEPDKSTVIVVTQDLNTMASELEQRQFDADEIRSFYSLASGEAEMIVRKYFPG